MPLTKSEQTILMFIAEGISDKYAIAKMLNKSYSVVYYAIEQLLKLRLIETSQSRKGEKNPDLEVKTYGLTLLGFCETLALSHMLDGNTEKIDLMVQRWRHLHLILSKWKFLNEKIPQHEVLASLETTATLIDAIWANNPNHKLLDEGGKTFFIKTFFICVLTVTPITGQFFQVEKWIEAIRSDKEFREFIKKQLKEDINAERKELFYREKLLDRL
jgi:DNA-binding PadR family transcriptional regulator